MTSPEKKKFDKRGFVRSDLHLRYQTLAEPQAVSVSLVFRLPTINLAHNAVINMRKYVEAGMAGGSMFAPWLGVMRKVEGPPADAVIPNTGPVTWYFELGGACPEGIRFFIDEIAVSHRITSAAISGVTPSPDGPQAVTEADVAAHIADPSYYPAAWPDPGFLVERIDSPRGISVELEMDQLLDEAVVKAVEGRLARWATLISGTYMNIDGPANGMLGMALLPKVALKKRSLVAYYATFNKVLEPSVNALVNVLSRFSRERHRIRRVVVGAAW